MSEANYIKFKDLWIRKDFAIDRVMINESLRNYSHFKLDKTSIVLDLGANVGGFAKMCMDANVGSYLGLEPNEENFKLLNLNVNERSKEPKYYFFRAMQNAVSTSHDEYISFYIRDTVRSASSSSTRPFKITSNMKEVKVPNMHIDYVMSIDGPNCLKMDIEGAERDIFEYWKGIVPKCVKQFAIEIHNEKFCKQFEQEYHTQMLKDGFKLVHKRANFGFVKHSTNVWKCFGEESTGTLWGFDLFYRRD